MLVHEFLEHSADLTPDKIALICDGQRLTYAQIEAQANRLANVLKAHGVQRGDRVVTFLPNSVELVVAIFATLKAGGVFVVVNHTTKRDKLVYVLDDCQATALVASNRSSPLAEQVASQVASLKANCHDWRRNGARQFSFL